MINVELPFPPSINHLWRRFGNRTLLSKHGRTYRARVCALLQGIKPLAGNLSVVIDMYPPDRRRRDVDNIQKAFSLDKFFIFINSFSLLETSC